MYSYHIRIIWNFGSLSISCPVKGPTYTRQSTHVLFTRRPIKQMDLSHTLNERSGGRVASSEMFMYLYLCTLVGFLQFNKNGLNHVPWFALQQFLSTLSSPTATRVSQFPRRPQLMARAVQERWLGHQYVQYVSTYFHMLTLTADFCLHNTHDVQGYQIVSW